MYMTVNRKRWTNGEENRNDREREGGREREGRKEKKEGTVIRIRAQWTGVERGARGANTKTKERTKRRQKRRERERERETGATYQPGSDSDEPVGRTHKIN